LVATQGSRQRVVEKWRAPSERIRTASEIPIEVNLADEDTIPVYMKVSEKVLHLRRLGMSYTRIADRLGVNLWMAKKAGRWGNRFHLGAPFISKNDTETF
jgi:hypothetical protein